MKITYKYKYKPTTGTLIGIAFGSILVLLFVLKEILESKTILGKIMGFVFFSGLSIVAIYLFFGNYKIRKTGKIKEIYIDLPKDAFDIKIDGKELK